MELNGVSVYLYVSGYRVCVCVSNCFLLKCCYVLYIDMLCYNVTSQGPGRITADVANGELK